MLKRIAKIVSVGLIGLGLVACGSDNGKETGDETVHVGILQFMEHNSLSAARDGFVSELEDAGYTVGENLEIEEMNAQGDQANIQSMSEKIAEKNELLLAIATPAAQGIATVEQDKPILFTAVTDAVDAGLVESNESPGMNLTGTSDMVPIDKQVDLLLSIDSEIEKVGIIYNSSEANSKIQAELATEAIEAQGAKAEVSTVTSTNDVQQVLMNLAENVDALYIPTDNTLASTADTVGEIALDYQLPVVAGSTEQVEAGGLATYGINYESLGRQTAKLAIEILENEANPASLAVELSNDLELVINEEMAENLGINPEDITIPEE